MCRVQREKTWHSGRRRCILWPCQGQNGNPGQYLLKLREKRIEKFLPEGGEEEVSVAWLLEGIEEPRISKDGEFEERRPARRFRPAPATVATTAGGAAAAAAPAAPASVVKSPWSAGSFYLFTVVVIFGMLIGGRALVDSWAALSGIAVASVLIGFFVYAAQLRHDDKITDKTFSNLMLAGLKRLNPFGGGASEGD